MPAARRLPPPWIVDEHPESFYRPRCYRPGARLFDYDDEHPWVDPWGNKTCQSFNGGAQYYDTSGGCPIGTYQWVDNWGNKICRSL